MPVSITGTVPDTIFENALRGDWVAYLTFSEDVLSAALTGSDAAHFATIYNVSRRLLTITPAQSFDAEQFAAEIVFSFGVTARTSTGWSVIPGSYSVTLLDIDDAPPENLRFVAGGVVLANDIGAPIGTLIADDPDSEGPLVYSVAWPDSAWFEIVGNELRVRQGVDLTSLAGTTREVLIEVSDGLNMQAFSLPVVVLAADPPSPFAIQDGTLLADTLAGSGLADAIFAHAGADLVLGAGGADSLVGGPGNDTLHGDAGADTLLGQDGDDRLFGGDGNDSLYGDDGDDWLEGGLGVDRIYGGNGADTLDGVAGVNRLIGGAGNDVYLLRSPLDVWIEVAGGGIDEIEVGWDMTMPAEIERLRLRMGAGHLNAIGSDRADSIFGNEGSNRLSGGQGHDWLDGGAGSDALLGELGNDTLLGGPGADTLSGGEGADSIRGDDGDDWIFGDAGDDTALGGAGADRIFGGSGKDWLEGGDGDDMISGGDGDDIIFGDACADLLTGGLGDDDIHGGDGDDQIHGGDGNDILFGGNGADRLNGGPGSDTVDGGPGSDDLQGGSGDDLLRGGGGAGDVLRGGDGADTLDAASGDRLSSLLFGGRGDDLYLIDSRSDQVIEATDEGIDTVFAQMDGGGYHLPANIENLTLMGTTYFGAGNDLPNLIIGNSLNNLLIGGDGSDTLRGGSGDDTLIGGDGSDLLIIDYGIGIDTLVDFAPGLDKIRFSGYAGLNVGNFLSKLTEIPSGTYISYDNSGLIIVGVHPSTINLNDIIFG